MQTQNHGTEKKHDKKKYDRGGSLDKKLGGIRKIR